jgi:hypothetical protein
MARLQAIVQEGLTPGDADTGTPGPPSAIPKKTWKYIEEIKERWKVPGLGITYVSAPRENQEDWVVEVRGYGVADSKGNPSTPDVSGHATQNPISLAMTWHRQKGTVRD